MPARSTSGVSEPRTEPGDLRVYVGPEQRAAVLRAVGRTGAGIVPAREANVVVWTADGIDGLESVLHPGVEWVQLAAGVDAWVGSGLVGPARTWTSARGLYAGRVAEHAVALILAAAKGLPGAARRNQWQEYPVRLLDGTTVGIVGAGSVGAETFRRLLPFNVRRIGLTRSGRRVPGADLSLPPGGLGRLLEESVYVVLTAPLTEETDRLIGRPQLELIGSDG